MSRYFIFSASADCTLYLKQSFFLKPFRENCTFDLTDSRSCNNNDIDTNRQPVLKFPVNLPDNSFCTVSMHSISDFFSGGNTQTVKRFSIIFHINSSISANNRNSFFIQIKKIPVFIYNLSIEHSNHHSDQI